MNGHAHVMLTKLLRLDGSSPLVRVDTADIIRAAAARCTVPLERESRHERCGGVWQFVRGQAVPGVAARTVFGLATCSKCPASRDAVVGPDGVPHGGPVFIPVREP